MNKFHYIKSDKQFQDIRLTKIGASDVPIIFGLTPQTPRELCLIKSGAIPPWGGDIRTDIGNDLEPVVLKHHFKEPDFIYNYYKIMQNPEIQKKNKTGKFLFTECFHKKYPWLMAHADCLVVGDYSYGIQAKTGGLWANTRRGDFDGYEIKDGTENGIPLKVYLQVQTEMMVYYLDNWVVSALIDTNNFYEWKIEANQKVQEKIIDVCLLFYECMESGKTPPPIGKNDVLSILPECENVNLTILGDKAAEARFLYSKFKEVKEKINKLKDQKEDLEAALFLLAGGNRIISDELGKIYSQTAFLADTMIGKKTIKENCPDVLEQLEKAGLLKQHEVRRIN